MAIVAAVPFSGMSYVAQLIGGTRSPNATFYCAYGTDDTTAANTDERLGAEVSRAVATITTISASVFEASYTFTIPYDLTVNEQGLYNGYGELVFRESGASLVKSKGDSLVLKIAVDVEDYVYPYQRFTTAGITEVRDLMMDNGSPSAFTHIAFGTGTTEESAARTTLVTETERVAVTTYFLSILSPFDTIRFAGLFTEVTSETTIAEVAVFNAATGGDMLLRELLDNTVVIPAGQRPVVVTDVILVGVGTQSV